MPNFWVGQEIEGRLKGLPTLFIKGDQTIRSISNALRQCNNRNIIISQLYFGAGNQSNINNFDIIQYFLSIGYFITIEILLDQLSNVPDNIIERCHIMVTIKSDLIDGLKLTDSIKFETKNYIYCTTKEQLITNDYLGYQNDIILEG